MTAPHEARAPITAVVAGNATRDALLYLDHIPQLDEVCVVQRRECCLGGRGVVPAVALSAAGAASSLCTVIGESARAEFQDFLTSQGISSDLVVWAASGRPVTEYTALVGTKEKDHVAYVEPAEIDWPSSDLATTLTIHSDLLYLSTNGLGFNRIVLSNTSDSTLVVQNLGVKFADEPDYLHDVMRRVDVIIGNVVETSLLCGDTGLSIREFLSQCSRLRYFIVTNGAEPVSCYENGTELVHRFPVDRVVDVISSVGAGDSFAAGLSVGLLRGWNIHDAVTLGMRLGAVAVRSQTSYVDRTLAKLAFEGSIGR